MRMYIVGERIVSKWLAVHGRPAKNAQLLGRKPARIVRHRRGRTEYVYGAGRSIILGSDGNVTMNDMLH